MPEFLTFMTAAKWIQNLAGKYAKSKSARGKEIDELANVFGDPADLARFYIHPNCAYENPADRDEDDDMQHPHSPLFEILEDFFARDIKKRDGRRHLFLLADAGMGKTSALVMLRLAHINRFWPGEYDCRLFKLGPDTLEQIDAIEAKARTILLLDALDEDSRVIDESVEHRLNELITRTLNFHRVVITCRTQFFPGVMETSGKIRIGNAFTCRSLYLAPFSDSQVEEYLSKSFPRTWKDWLRIRDNPQLEPARKLALSIRSLRCRPMLLAHIEDLVNGSFEPGDDFGIYLHLVFEWLRREERKSIERRVEDPDWPLLKIEELGHACARVAIWLQCRGARLISRAHLEILIESDPLVRHLKFVEVGGRSLLNRTAEGDYRFSHYSIQEFLVVFAAAHGKLSSELRPIGTTQMLFFAQSWMRRQKELAHSPLDQFDWHVPWTELDLAKAYLLGVNLEGANLEGANLEGANLEGANLEGAILFRANLFKANLFKANLEGANLSEANLEGAKLEGANLSGANLEGTKLEGANLFNANLKRANLSGAKLEGANLFIANLEGANLSEANLEGAKLEGANLSGANLEVAKLEGANLFIASLNRANLNRANLKQAELNGAKLEGANLFKANLEGANLEGASLFGAKLFVANFKNVLYNEHTQWPHGFKPPED